MPLFYGAKKRGPQWLAVIFVVAETSLYDPDLPQVLR